MDNPLQIQTVYDKFNRYKKDISDVSNALFLDWCNNIKWDLYRRLTETTPDDFYSTHTIPYVSGTASYTLPSDFGDMKGWKCGVFKVNESGSPYEPALPYTGFGSLKEGYYLDGNNIVFTPANANLFSQNPVLRYIPKQTELTSLSEYFTVDGTSSGTTIIPQEFADFAVKAVDVFYTQWDEDLGMESVSDFRYKRILSEILKHTRKTPSVFGLDGQMTNY